MKKFEVPAIQVENFSVEDVITVSSNENQTPTIPGGFGGVEAITPLP